MLLHLICMRVCVLVYFALHTVHSYVCTVDHKLCYVNLYYVLCTVYYVLCTVFVYCERILCTVYSGYVQCIFGLTTAKLMWTVDSILWTLYF